MIFRHRFGGWIQSSLLVLVALVALGGRWALADLKPPPTPTTYFTDQAGVIDAATGQAINQKLEQFERDTSNQVLVAIYPSLPPDAEVAQYATLTYNAWGVGQKGPSVGTKGGDNGAILFVFVNDRKVFIVTGRGLEGALPDAICKRIITQLIAPAFKQGNYALGVQQGVAAIIAATKGEYKGTGRTRGDGQQAQEVPVWLVIVIILIIILLQMFVFPNFRSGPMVYTSGGYGGGYGGGGGGGGGGFSGGGGSSAGGGAGGSW